VHGLQAYSCTRCSFEAFLAGPVARALGKRWERRLPAGPGDEVPLKTRSVHAWAVPTSRLEAGAPSTIEVVPIRRKWPNAIVTSLLPPLSLLIRVRATGGDLFHSGPLTPSSPWQKCRRAENEGFFARSRSETGGISGEVPRRVLSRPGSSGLARARMGGGDGKQTVALSPLENRQVQHDVYRFEVQPTYRRS